jgi:two-component system, OmpR family, alkaline phosphatase synthesis response regulator PhoP
MATHASNASSTHQPPLARRILVIEDDPSISLGLRINLEAEGYVVGVAEDGRAGLDRVTSEAWDAIILDVMLPKLNGFEVVRHMRSLGDHTPVLMLSAKSAESDKVMGLELGAEDYITKPFGVGEVLARIKVALRRRPPVTLPDPRVEPNVAMSPVYRFADVEIDPRTREVRRAGELVDLTATEFDILESLLLDTGAVVSRRKIFERVWGPNHHGTPRTIDNFVGHLRQKLEVDPADPKHIMTVRGIGYRLVR